MTLVILAVWSVCGVLAYGATFGHFQNKFPSLADAHYISDMGHAVLSGLLGPIGLLAIASLNGLKYGFKWL